MGSLSVENSKERIGGARRRAVLRRGVEALGAAAVLSATVFSAIIVKETRHGMTPMVKLDRAPAVTIPAATDVTEEVSPEAPIAPDGSAATIAHTKDDRRWFNGRLIRPVRTIRMVVTAYSPDARSCGGSADGYTATLHSVHTNAGKLVAADPRVLAYGSMLSIPGYDSARVVPVLDCGGAIKGNRLDVLFPTHEQARRWGVRRLNVTVWEYADGGPKRDNPRRHR